MECETIERYNPDGTPIMKSKVKFDTLDEAIKHAKWVNSQDHVIHKVVAYKCSKCHKYHVGRNGKELTVKQRNKFKMKTLKLFAIIGTMLFIVSCHNGDLYTIEVTDHHGQKDTMVVQSTRPPYIGSGGLLYVVNKGNVSFVATGIDKVAILKEGE